MPVLKTSWKTGIPLPARPDILLITKVQIRCDGTVAVALNLRHRSDSLLKNVHFYIWALSFGWCTEGKKQTLIYFAFLFQQFQNLVKY